MGTFEFKLPDIGEGVVEGEIVEWHVATGDKVTEDQPLVDMMTDKATVMIPSSVNGTVTELAGVPGDMIPVGSTLIIRFRPGARAAEADRLDRRRRSSHFLAEFGTVGLLVHRHASRLVHHLPSRDRRRPRRRALDVVRRYGNWEQLSVALQRRQSRI